MFFSLVLHLVVLILLVMIGWVWQDGRFALAALYGGLVALTNSGMLTLRWYRGLKVYHCDGQRHLSSFNRSMLERFFVVGILLAVGFGILGLSPLALLAGFIVGQLVWVLALFVTRRLF